MGFTRIDLHEAVHFELGNAVEVDSRRVLREHEDDVMRVTLR